MAKVRLSLLRGHQIACGILLFWGAFVAGCAHVSTDSTIHGNGSAKPAAPEEPLPYSGPKKLVMVVELGIPKQILEKYPKLADKYVGWGLCNRIVEELYDTGQFDYVEDKEELQRRVLEQWQAQEQGIFFNEENRKPPRSPDYFIYAEVFDFGISEQERIVGTRKREVTVTKIGIQIRFMDSQTMQYIPGTGTGEEILSHEGNVWSGLDHFDQTQVGMASQKAIKNALWSALQRIDRRELEH